MPIEDYVTVAEAAKQTRKSQQVVRNKIKSMHEEDPKTDKVKKIGWFWVIHKSEVQKLKK